MNIFIALMITSVILIFVGMLISAARHETAGIGLIIILVGATLGFTAFGASKTDWGKTVAAKSKLKRALKHQSSYSDKEIKDDTYYLEKAAEEMGLTPEEKAAAYAEIKNHDNDPEKPKGLPGKQADNYDITTCPECNGEGFVYGSYDATTDVQRYFIKGACPICEGTGKIEKKD